MPNLLLTSVGRRVELVKALKAAYAQHGFRGNLVATDVDWMAPALQFVDRPYLVPRSKSAEFLPALERICVQEEVDLIVPLIDPDIPVLANSGLRLQETGAKLAVVGAAAAQIAQDKWLANQFFAGLGLPVPRSWLPTEPPLHPCEFPCFIKPRDGSAAENTFAIHSAVELEFFCKYVSAAIVQEYLPGPEITCDVICDLQGEVLTVVQRQRISVRGGEAIKSETIHRPDLDQMCRTIAQRLPAVGPITVQCMLKEDQPRFIEINARLGGGLPLAMAAGLDVPGILLHLADGKNPRVLVAPYRIGVTMTRFDHSVFLTRADRERLEGHRF